MPNRWCGVRSGYWPVSGLGALALFATQTSPLLIGLLVLVCAVTGVFARDWWLTRAVQRARQAILAEFPVVAEMLALAVTAGEGPTGAIERIWRLAAGPLVDQLTGIIADIHAGTPLLEAISTRPRPDQAGPAGPLPGRDAGRDRARHPARRRIARAGRRRPRAGKRALMESGGRREIAMMVPVVFGILPTTILFALYPGLVAVSALAGRLTWTRWGSGSCWPSPSGATCRAG